MKVKKLLEFKVKVNSCGYTLLKLIMHFHAISSLKLVSGQGVQKTAKILSENAS